MGISKRTLYDLSAYAFHSCVYGTYPFYVRGVLKKEILNVERFEDAEMVAKARQPVGRIVAKNILVE